MEPILESQDEVGQLLAVCEIILARSWPDSELPQ